MMKVNGTHVHEVYEKIKVLDYFLAAARGPWTPIFLTHLVILCFVRRCSKQNTVARLN